MSKKVQRRSVITFILSIVAMIAMVLLGVKTTAQEAGGSQLSLNNVTVTSFKITDVTNGNKEIEYKKQSDAQYEEYKSDPSRFSNALNEGQVNSEIKINLSISYSAQQALKEGDTLVIPATLDKNKGNFSSKPLYDGENHELGTWEYKNGNVAIRFSGDYLKNNKVTKFTASFETGLMKIYSSSRPKTTKLGERLADPGIVGNEKFVVGTERPYVVTSKFTDTSSLVTKFAAIANDSTISWHFDLASDYQRKNVNGRGYNFFDPYMLQHNGEHSPKALTEIYIEDTVTGVVENPSNLSINVFVSGIDDDGNVVGGDFVISYNPNKLKRVEQGNRSKEEVKESLQKGEYSIYDNHDGSYTLMLKWWDMNDPNGIKYDDIPAVKQAGGVGNYLKASQPDLFGQFKSETIEKINALYSGKSIQNVFFYFTTKFATVREKTEIINTAIIQTKQHGVQEKKATGVLTPAAGVADAPSDPLSIKLLKTDVKTGKLLSEGFKFELQSSDDNGTTWNKVELNQGMIVKGNLNADNTVTPNEEGAVEVNSLINGTSYRFVEKAHADGYKDVTEDNANPNTAKNPTAANSRVVKVSVQDSGKVVVMYNEQKPETVSVEGTKTWDDADNQDGKRPAQITVNLLKNGQKVDSKTVTEADGWKWTFDNLDKYENDAEITYTVEEETVEGYTATVNGYNITNTHTPGKTNVQVTKKWDDADNQDGKRPSSVTFELYADGQKTDKTLVLNQENNWTGSFAELDEYKAGKQIEYTVKEFEVENGYTASILGSIKNGFVVTNTRATEKTTVEGTKTWDDADNQDGKRPEAITINLLKNGEKVASKTVTEADGWKWTFDNLAKYENGKEITYSIVEEQVESYSSKVNGYNVTNSYTPGKTSVHVTKKWDDADDKEGKRPASVTITLYADGEKTDKTLVLDKENNWTGNFTELDEYKAGEKIEYSIKEEPVGNGYVSEISGNVTEGFVVTNTRTPDPEVPVTPAEAVIKATKELVGKELTKEQFEFELSEGGNVIATSSNGKEVEGVEVATNEVAFKLSYTEPGEHEYVLTEKAGSVAGVEYSKESHTIHVSVVDNGEGKLVATVKEADSTRKFTNTYKASSAEAVIKATKELVGKELTKEQFEFELSEGGNVIATSSNGKEVEGVEVATNEVAFKLSYTEPGEHEYVLTEKAGSEEGVTYSEESYTVHVSVVDNGDGKLVATVKEADSTRKFTNTYTPPTPDKPVDPTPDKPVDPTPDKPVDPTPDKPVDPTPDKPVDPTPDKPVDPTPDKPVDPTPDKPVDPTPDKPVDPTPDKPVDPTPGKPVDPTPGKPVDPTPGKPVDPTPGKPVDPTPGKPVDPTPNKPVSERPSQPSTAKEQLPNTGENSSISSTVLGLVAGLVGFVAFGRRKKEDEK